MSYQNHCVQSKKVLETIYKQLESEGRAAVLFDSHVKIFDRSPGALGELVNQGEWHEVAHVWAPAEYRSDRCRLCHGPKTAAIPDDEG